MNKESSKGLDRIRRWTDHALKKPNGVREVSIGLEPPGSEEMMTLQKDLEGQQNKGGNTLNEIKTLANNRKGCRVFTAPRRATEFCDEVWEKSIDVSEKPTTFTFKVRKRDYDDGSSPIQNVSIFLPDYTASRLIFIYQQNTKN
jgi:hypothetical protein